MTFDELFNTATGHPPFPFQRALAQADLLPNLLEVPTGAGKTATAVLGWLWRRRFAESEVRRVTPRRLVFCLPMRSLVFQTQDAVRTWLARLNLLDVVQVHALLGGAIDNSFDRYPEADMVLVGTQDQLLSRALNRGYAVSRYRWPMHYALLNNDCLWVMDEIQLMGVGLSTSSQLAALREAWGACGPVASLWMSATLDPRLLSTVDAVSRELRRHTLGALDRAAPCLARRLDASKRLALRSDLFDPDGKVYARAVAKAVVEAHVGGTRTLVVMNRVERAQAVHALLADQGAELLHSRYRPADRRVIEARVLEQDRAGILVATQAIEAGVDISSKTLFTELAPWSSLVQRFGRCNRRGEWGQEDPGRIHVIDLPGPEPGLPEKLSASANRDYAAIVLPYIPEELDRARALVTRHPDAAPRTLDPGLPEGCDPAGPVVRRRDVFELFDTTPDLSGRDIDISRWIRDDGRPDVQLAWRDVSEEPAEGIPALHRDELCKVPLHSAERFVAGAARRDRGACWTWDSLAGRWRRVTGRLVPGRSYLLKRSAGGYDPIRGWTGARKHVPAEVLVPIPIQQDDDEADRLTLGAGFVSIVRHAAETYDQCRTLATRLPYDLPWGRVLEAARWHDLGKVHPAFQEMLVSALAEDDPLRRRGPWAKSDGRPGGQRCRRPHFRHELVSALAMIERGRDDLAAYLVACHHGKVRLAIRSRPTEPGPRDGRAHALGVYDQDLLPATDLAADTNVPETRLRLDLMELGSDGRPSWAGRALALLDTWGPFRLALMETLVRVADWRASALHTEEVSLA